jgi:hypothetical protein
MRFFHGHSILGKGWALFLVLAAGNSELSSSMIHAKARSRKIRGQPPFDTSIINSHKTLFIRNS